MRIGLDVMGGDFAPGAVLEGALDALKHLSPGERIVLVGDESRILDKLKAEGTDPSLCVAPSRRIAEPCGDLHW